MNTAITNSSIKNISTTKVAGIDLELFQAGTGRPLLFLHGALGYDPWQQFAALLVPRCRVIAPSHPGFGRSSLPDWLDRIDDIANVYLALLDRLDVDDLDLVGCSVGGWIAAELASWAPRRFRRVVLVGPAGIKVGSRDKLDIPDVFAMPQGEVDKLIYHDPERMTPDLAKMSDEELAIVFRNRETLALLTWEPWMHNPKLRQRLHRVRAPTLLVRGESDGLVSADYLAAYARLLPSASIATIRGAGHTPHLEQPQALASTISAFLET